MSKKSPKRPAPKSPDSAKPSISAPAFGGKLSIIIPCYNESRRIPQMLKALQDFDKKWRSPYEIIVVDDGSSDDTHSAASAALAGLPGAQVLRLPNNQGKGAALKAGVAAATGDWLLTLDADMAATPSELLQWLASLKQFDAHTIYIGSREHEASKVQGTMLRRAAGLAFNFTTQLFTNLPFADTQCGFKLYPAAIGKALFAGLRSKGFAHDVELLYRAQLEGTPIVAMPLSWTHQAESKVSLGRDSFGMFWQTFFIALRQKWDWFVAKPLRDLGQRPAAGGEPSHYRLLFVLLALGLFVAMPLLSGDYGITGDEEVQKVYGEKVLAYFQSGGEDRSALEYKNLYYYGGFFDLLCAAANHYIGGMDPYDMRHLINALFGAFLFVFAGKLAKEVSGSWRMGFWAMLLVALSPRLFGHAMNNPKDIPFAAAYAFTMLYIVRFLQQLPKPGLKTIVMLALGIAFAISVRVGGLLLIAYLGLFTLLMLLFNPRVRQHYASLPRFGSLLGTGLLIAVAGYAGGLLFWPYALEAPLSHPFKALGEMQNFSTGIRMLFEGRLMWSDELPWYYIPKWILISAPLAVLLGALLYAVFFAKNPRRSQPALHAVAFTTVFPVAYAVAQGSSLYDGMRHFLFIYPMLVVLAAWGWHQLATQLPQRWGGYVAGGAIALLLAEPGWWMWRNHPYQYVYFNPIAGGTEAAYGRYETDYWMVSMKRAADWLLAHEPRLRENGGEGITVNTNCAEPVKHYLRKAAPKVKVQYTHFRDRNNLYSDYDLFISRFIEPDLLATGAYPPAEWLHSETVDGVPIGTVSKRGTPYGQQAYEASKAQNHAEAARLYALETQQHPKNEAAWLGLATAHFQLRDYAACRRAIDAGMALTQQNTNLLNLLAFYHLNTGQQDSAKIVFERIVDWNYKFNTPYYYLATFAAQAGNATQALDYLESFDATGGNIPQAFDLGAQVAQQLGNNAAAYYFTAKKEYTVNKNFQAAYNNLQNALQYDAAYPPAVALKKAFDEALAAQEK